MKDTRKSRLKLIQGGKKTYHPDSAIAARFRIAALVLWMIAGFVTWVQNPSVTHLMMLVGIVCFAIAMGFER